jgi:hypothetical protein
MSTNVERGIREPAPEHHERIFNYYDTTRVTSSKPSLASVSFKCDDSEVQNLKEAHILSNTLKYYKIYHEYTMSTSEIQ